MLKALYICSRESDYLQDLIYSGLCEILGAQRVIDWPWNRNFHWPRKKYPRNLGYRHFNFTHFDKLVLGADRIPWNEVGVVFVAATKPDCFESYLSLQSKIPSGVPVVFLDGGDFPEIGGDLHRLKRPELLQEVEKKRPFDFVFKREMLEDKSYPTNTAPLPFAIPFHLMAPPDEGGKYDVSFWAVESDPVRTQALELIEDKFDCRENGTTRNQVFKKYKRKGFYYLQELARCKVVLNFRGVGWDTLRYWEVFGLHGFLISQRPKIVIPDNFEHGKEIIFCKDDLSDLVDLCQYYLDHPRERIQIAKMGSIKAQRKHSTQARAQFVLDTLKSQIKLQM